MRARGGSVDVQALGGSVDVAAAEERDDGFSGCWRPNVAGRDGSGDERYQAHVFEQAMLRGRPRSELNWAHLRGG